MRDKYKMPRRERLAWAVVGGFMFPLITLAPLLALPWWRWMPLFWIGMWAAGAMLISGIIEWVDSW